MEAGMAGDLGFGPYHFDRGRLDRVAHHQPGDQSQYPLGGYRDGLVALADMAIFNR